MPSCDLARLPVWPLADAQGPRTLFDVAETGLEFTAPLPGYGLGDSFAVKKATTAGLNSRWKAARSNPAGSRQPSGAMRSNAGVHGARNAKWPAFGTTWYSGFVGSPSYTLWACRGCGRISSLSPRQSWIGTVMPASPSGVKEKPMAGATITAAAMRGS